MKSPHAFGICTLLLIAVDSAVTDSAIRHLIEGIVKGTIHVDDSRHANRFSTETEQRSAITDKDEKNDVILLQDETDHSRCREVECGQYKPDVSDLSVGNIGSRYSISFGKPISTDNNIHISFDPNAITSRESTGGHITVGDLGTHPNSGGKIVIHVVNQPDKHESYVPERIYNRAQIPVSAVPTYNEATRLLTAPTILYDDGFYDGGSSGGHYLKTRPGADSFLYGEKAFHPGVSGGRKHHSREGFGDIIFTAKDRERGRFSAPYPALHGGFSGALPRKEEDAEFLELLSRYGDLSGLREGLENRHSALLDGLTESEDKIWVHGYDKHGTRIPGHYDTPLEVLQHHG